MKRIVLFIASLVSLSPTIAQSITWSRAPQTGFVFQITNDEAQKLLTKSRPDTIIKALLHTRIDTFNVNRGWTRRPEKGHFILARIVENKLHCEYTSVFPYQVLLLKGYDALSLQVLDLEGNVRKDAKVKFKTRRIWFDSESRTYRIANEAFTGSSKNVTVELDGFRSVFNIEKHEVPTWSNEYFNYDDGPDFYSYMITDKNKYKPGEKVRFKSYALSGSRSPIRRDLEVWLIRSGKPLQVGTISPHRPGSFAGEVQLHDSLRLTLDQYYSLQLWEKNGRVVSNCTFKYEDYELNGNKLQVEIAAAKHFHPSSNSVEILATSENGLILKDARAYVSVLTENIRETFQPVVSLPDTLTYRGIQLESNRPTVVEIPSALFQRSNTSYFVHVVVLNSQNQRMEKSVAASHYFSQYEITAAYSADSVVFQMLNNGTPMPNIPVKIYRDGSQEAVDMILPHSEKINPAAETIRIESALASRLITLEDMLPKLSFQGGISKDSFNLSVDNPQRIGLSWYVYQGSDLLEKGFGEELDFKSNIEDRSRTYYAELLYSFGGSDHITSKGFPFREASLDIALSLPDRVFPGQKTKAWISVTDEEGNPVSGVDLTALATTAKLNYYLPELPYYGSTSDPRPEKATYSKNEVNKRTAILDLDYERWARLARLDTMKYYQFTYPVDSFFFHQVDIADGTQFAPYVMKDGVAKKVYVIEVNHMPVYYSWTDHPKGYSFYAKGEKVSRVTLRLYDRVLILDSMCFDAGKKTIFSLDLDRLPAGVSVHRISPHVEKLSGRRKRVTRVFTGTEIKRHTPWLAAFVETSKPAYLSRGKQFVPVSPGANTARKVIVGPILSGTQTYTEHPGVETTYTHEGGFSYAFEGNIVYKMEAPSLFPNSLADVSYQPMNSINDLAINKALFLSPDRYVPEKWYPRLIDLVDPACRVKVILPLEVAMSGVASVLFQDLKTGDVMSPCRTYAGPRDYHTIPRGWLHFIVLYNNGTYLKMDSVHLRSYSNVVVNLKDSPLHGADPTSREWLDSVGNNCFPAMTAPPRRFTLIGPRYSYGNVHGTVLADDYTPLPGVNVVIKGTNRGTTTDVNGRFFLDVYEDPTTLVVSFIGFASEEVEVSPGSEISIVMQADVMQLQEVVVVGYGAMARHELAASVSIRGKVAGVTITQQNEDEETAKRMVSDDSASEAENKLYQELLALNTIRSQFSDVAFWEPRLFTDRHGKSEFEITFPDDITRWDAVVYGMTRHLQTGTARKSIRSYKPMMAELHVPQFLTAGDSADLLGKILNYTSDKTITGKSRWAGAQEKDVTFDSFHTEKFSVTASSDTLTAGYSFTRDDGYFDGEERKVPVVERGTLRAEGTLSILENNDIRRVEAPKGRRVNVKILDNQLDVYAGDVRYLLHYRYDCNEQLASKLIGLINHKHLNAYEGKSFRYDRDVNRIIRRLLKNQNSEFLWSWWDVSPNTSYWMSAHILRALKAAKDAGYTVHLDLDNVARKATYKYEFHNQVSTNDAHILHALALWDVDLDYQRYVNILDDRILYDDSVARVYQKKYRYGRRSQLNEKLLLLEVRQLQGLPFVRDSLLRYLRKTVLNEVYFSDNQSVRYWYCGPLVNNAVAYRIIKRDSALSHLTTSMQMYFLGERRKGSWNTYEASNVLMSMLPDLIAQGSSRKVPASVSLEGKVNERIQSFPYEIGLIEGEQLQVRKETGLPLYFMQYTEERVTRAQASADAFTISTRLSNPSPKVGEPVIIEVTVEVKRDASLEHVMIEIPIPGGCSYVDKIQRGSSVETHREYFKERTSIFCENMTAGRYVFHVHLLPRFTGRYHVNPAQVSLMYFPIINANTDMVKVGIVSQ